MVWRVFLDRCSDESMAKSGSNFSVIETANHLIEKYRLEKTKPEVEIYSSGLAWAMSDYLTAKKIPHTLIKSTLLRCGSADIYKIQSPEI